MNARNGIINTEFPSSVEKYDTNSITASPAPALIPIIPDLPEGFHYPLKHGSDTASPIPMSTAMVILGRRNSNSSSSSRGSPLPNIVFITVTGSMRITPVFKLTRNKTSKRTMYRQPHCSTALFFHETSGSILIHIALPPYEQGIRRMVHRLKKCKVHRLVFQKEHSAYVRINLQQQRELHRQRR